MSRLQVLSLSGLLLAAAGLGLALGLGAVPPGETEIIEAAAARYVAETGGAPTDCAARPAAIDGVRLIVTCGTGGADAWVEALDGWGTPVAVALDAEGPET
mgnify:CR=1 FL=1